MRSEEGLMAENSYLILFSIQSWYLLLPCLYFAGSLLIWHKCAGFLKMMMLSVYYSNAILNGLAQHIWIKNPIKDAIFLCYLFAKRIHIAFLSQSEYNTVYLFRVMWFPALNLRSLNRLFTSYHGNLVFMHNFLPTFTKYIIRHVIVPLLCSIAFHLKSSNLLFLLLPSDRNHEIAELR